MRGVEHARSFGLTDPVSFALAGCDFGETLRLLVSRRRRAGESARRCRTRRLLGQQFGGGGRGYSKLFLLRDGQRFHVRHDQSDHSFSIELLFANPRGRIESVLDRCGQVDRLR